MPTGTSTDTGMVVNDSRTARATGEGEGGASRCSTKVGDVGARANFVRHQVSSATRKGPPLRHELGTTPSAVIGQALTSFW